jgi:hypothetical protein
MAYRRRQTPPVGARRVIRLRKSGRADGSAAPARARGAAFNSGADHRKVVGSEVGLCLLCLIFCWLGGD